MYKYLGHARSHKDLRNENYTPIKTIPLERKSDYLFTSKENIQHITSLNFFNSPKNSMNTQSQPHQKSQAQINFSYKKPPCMNNHYRLVSQPSNENKENQKINIPISYMDRFQALELSKQFSYKNDQINNFKKNTSSQENLPTMINQSPNNKIQQSKANNNVQQQQTKSNYDRSNIFQLPAQINVKQQQQNQEIKENTTAGFLTYKLKIKNNISNYNNYYQLNNNNNNETIKAKSCPILSDNIESDRNLKQDSLTPPNKTTNYKRDQLIFKKYMSHFEDHKPSQQLKSNIQKKLSEMTQQNTSVEKQIKQTSNSSERSKDFSQLQKYYGLKYEQKQERLKERKAGKVLKIKNFQLVVRSKELDQKINNQQCEYEYDMKPWDIKNEKTFVSEKMDSSLQEILDSLC